MCRLLIKDEDIQEAELAILGEGKHFNKSQVAFIKCLDTIDLTACPGSGKTTALVAKLYILAKYEVWKSGDPICVISHTRIAIDEIKDKVASHFPRIMDYPNFIGTIQQFTDKYLAIPYYKSLGLNEVRAIDDEIFANKWRTQNTWTLRTWLMNNRECQTDADYDKKISSLNYHHNDEIKIAPHELFLTNMTGTSYQQALAAKENLFKAGYLTYADTRNLATAYIQNYPNITRVLTKRFFYIFLDEAQDTSPEQMGLLESFVDSGCYQRIGDPLQTIFNADSDAEDVWLNREDTPRLSLMVSNRFGKKIARLVNHIGIGLDPEHNLSSAIEDSSYQKCIALIFDDDKPETVLEWFSTYAEQELNFLDTKSLYAIGAVGKYKEDKFTINSYLSSYSNDRKLKLDYFKKP
jgi:methylglyoxal synthase